MAEFSGRLVALRFSDFIDFKKFQRESRRLFLFCFLLSVIVHVLGGIFIPVHRTFVFRVKEATPPWTVVGEIITIPPLVANPYDTWRMRVPSRRMERSRSEALRMRTRSDLHSAAIPIPGIRDRMRIFSDRALPPVTLPLNAPGNDRAIRPGDIKFPEFPFESRVGRYSPSASGMISMKEEMLTFEDLDTSQFMGIIEPNPENLQAVRGIIHLPLAVWGTHLIPAVDSRRAIDGFTSFIKSYTLIKPVIDPPVHLDSPRLLEYPFIYITAEKSFDLTDMEKKNLGVYLRNGGFAFIEAYGELTRDAGTIQALYNRGMSANATMDSAAAGEMLIARLNAKFEAPLIAAPSMRQMLREALGARSRLAPIPRDHPLYHCFYDIENPPGVQKVLNTDGSSGQQPRNILEGITIDGRLVAVLSEKQYGIIWKEFGNPNPPKNVPIDMMGKMGINILVLGMLQQGGLAVKVME